jgi:hypothetical protein
MKSTKRKKTAVIKPLLKKLIDQHRTNSKVSKQNPKVGSKPLKPAELDQDSGGGDNRDQTLPQA